MKVRLGALMMTLLLIFTGCSGKTTDSANELRGQLARIAACEIECGLTADYGENVYSFKLAYSYDADGESTLTVIEPEEIAGLQIALSGGTTALLFDSVRLDTGTVADSGLTPVTALPMMLSAWAEGSLIFSCEEKRGGVECLYLLTGTDDGLQYGLWVGKDSFIPLCAEIIHEEKTVISCSFARFEVTETEESYGTEPEDLG